MEIPDCYNNSNSVTKILQLRYFVDSSRNNKVDNCLINNGYNNNLYSAFVICHMVSYCFHPKISRSYFLQVYTFRDLQNLLSSKLVHEMCVVCICERVISVRKIFRQRFLENDQTDSHFENCAWGKSKAIIAFSLYCETFRAIIN